MDVNKQVLVKDVLLEHTCQDVATALGAPSRVFYKSEDKMKIHSPNAHLRVMTKRSDYFFNYFTLGLVSITLFYHKYNILYKIHFIILSSFTIVVGTELELLLLVFCFTI